MSYHFENYRIRNEALGQTCGHHHHTRAKALQCIDRMGWKPCDCVVETFSGDDENMNHKKGRQPSCRRHPELGRGEE